MHHGHGHNVSVLFEIQVILITKQKYKTITYEKKKRRSSSNYRSLYLRKWIERLKYIELHAIIWLTKRFVAKNKHVKVLKLTINNRGI